MKTPFSIALGLAILFIAIPVISPAGEALPPADASGLWTHITREDPYLGWGYWPGYYGIYEGKSPHGAWLKVYANGVALKAAREGQRILPAGSIIVKENYGKDKKSLKAITPMYKVKGFNPAGGDWFWAKYGPDGKALASGKVKGCIDCHGVKKDGDWRFLQPK